MESPDRQAEIFSISPIYHGLQPVGGGWSGGVIFFNRPYQTASLYPGSNICIVWRPGPKWHHSAVPHTLLLFVLDQNEL